MATTTDLSLLALATGVCGLIGVVLTLIALVTGIVCAIRNQQWRWLVAIPIGTALPLPAAVAVFNAIYPLSEQHGVLAVVLAVVPYYVGLACIPLAVGVYSVVGLRSSAAEARESGRSS